MRQTGKGFRHQALLYANEQDYLGTALPFLREGIEAGGAAMAAVTRTRAALLRGALGPNAGAVEFVAIEEVGRNPARIIPRWQQFLDANADKAGPLCGLGEPIWDGRSAAEVDECRRQERLLDIAFGRGRAWTLLCPYDTRTLSPQVLATAKGNHADGAQPSTGDGDRCSFWAGVWSPFAGDLPPAPAATPSFGFGRDELAGVRRLIEREAGAAGMSRYRTTDLVTATSELTANSVLHGGGAGELCSWREDGEMLVEVSDRGRIDDPLVGLVKPGINQLHGRGLWLANQLCDLVRIRSGTPGTTIRLHVEIG